MHMKILLGCLMCLVLGASQCFAISGGPFGGASHVTVTGTYAGVFVPIPVTNPTPPPATITDNSLVLFTLKIPRTGLASGVAAVFRNGIFYVGTIVGSADPDTAKLTGEVNAAFFQVSSTSTTSTTIKAEYDANGKFVNAKVVANQTVGSSSATRIRGKASLTNTNDATVSGVMPDPNGESGPPYCSGTTPCPIEYKIHGFKQSEATS